MTATLVCDARPLFAESLASYLRRRTTDDVLVVLRPEDVRRVVASTPVSTVVLSLPADTSEVGAVVAGCASARLVVLLPRSDDALTLAALAAGASAVCSRQLPLPQVAAVVLDVSEPQPRVAVPAWDTTRTHVTRFLTPRQCEVLDHLVSARSTEEIATHMGITPATARGYVQTVLEKLGVHSRLQAVALAGTTRGSWCG